MKALLSTLAAVGRARPSVRIRAAERDRAALGPAACGPEGRATTVGHLAAKARPERAQARLRPRMRAAVRPLAGRWAPGLPPAVRRADWRTTAAALVLALGASAAGAEPAFAPEVGAAFPLSAPISEDGALGGALEGRPALVMAGYHACPNLCGTAQDALLRALADSGLAPEAYRILFLSVDPSETPAQAEATLRRLAEDHGAAALRPWRMPVGERAAAFARRLGMASEAQARTDEFIHPVGLVALTPEGRIARILPGIGWEPRDLRLALVEASEGAVGGLADRVLLFCAGFDETQGRYTSAVAAGLRVAGAATLGLMVAGIGVLVLRERRR